MVRGVRGVFGGVFWILFFGGLAGGREREERGERNANSTETYSYRVRCVSFVFLASDDIKAADCCVAVVCSVAKVKLDASVYQLGFLCFVSIGKKSHHSFPLKEEPAMSPILYFILHASLCSFLHRIFRGVRIS